MSYVRIWIHFVWSTKNRDKIINNNIKRELLAHIKENARVKGIYIREINCVSDHIHLLVSLSKDQNVKEIAQLIKGESSFWINKNKLVKNKFAWQEEYFAVSVSESKLNDVINYIRNQEEHHRVKSFSEEYELFKKKFGFS